MRRSQTNYGLKDIASSKVSYELPTPLEKCIRVALRVRPFSIKENSTQSCLTISGKDAIYGSKMNIFSFNEIFNTGSTQADVFRKFVLDLVNSCLNGYNGTLLAYGQTGSGKSFTMGTSFKENANPEEVGIIPRVLEYLFDEIKKIKAARKKENPDITLHIQFLEIYNETTNDLLKKNTEKIKFVPTDQGILVCNCSKIAVTSVAEALELLRKASLLRKTSQTRLNEYSSRSHAIVTLYVTQEYDSESESAKKSEAYSLDSDEALDDLPKSRTTITSKLHFVDLAGSERSARTGAIENEFREGCFINTSLTELKNVIDALSQNRTPVYRNSELTLFLKDSLGGNSMTRMIACVSPSLEDSNETLSTLSFSTATMSIKNKIFKNEDKTINKSKELEKHISELKNELETYKKPQRGRYDIDKNEEDKYFVDIDGSKVAVQSLKEEYRIMRLENDRLRGKIKQYSNIIERSRSDLSDLYPSNRSMNRSGFEEKYIEMVDKYNKLEKLYKSTLLELEDHKNVCPNNKVASDLKHNKAYQSIRFHSDKKSSDSVSEKKTSPFNTDQDTTTQVLDTSLQSSPENQNAKTNELISKIIVDLKRKLNESEKNNAELKRKMQEAHKNTEKKVDNENILGKSKTSHGISNIRVIPSSRTISNISTISSSRDTPTIRAIPSSRAVSSSRTISNISGIPISRYTQSIRAASSSRTIPTSASMNRLSSMIKKNKAEALDNSKFSIEKPSVASPIQPGKTSLKRTQNFKVKENPYFPTNQSKNLAEKQESKLLLNEPNTAKTTQQPNQALVRSGTFSTLKKKDTITPMLKNSYAIKPDYSSQHIFNSKILKFSYTLFGHTDTITSLDLYGINAIRLITSSNDRTVKIWNFNASSEIMSIEYYPDKVNKVIYREAKKFLFTLSNGVITLWYLKYPECRFMEKFSFDRQMSKDNLADNFSITNSISSDMEVDKNADFVFLATYDCINVWSLKNYSYLGQFVAERLGYFTKLAFNNANNELLVTCADNIIRVYNTKILSEQDSQGLEKKHMKLVVTHHAKLTFILIAEPFLFSFSRDSNIKKLQLQNYECVTQCFCDEKAQKTFITAADYFNKDNTLITGSSHGLITIMNADTMEVNDEIQTHQGQINSIKRVNNKIISVGKDGKLKVWEISKK